jgi:hypothetical protein
MVLSPVNALTVLVLFELGSLQTSPRDDALALLLTFGSPIPGEWTFTSLASCHAQHTRLDQLTLTRAEPAFEVGLDFFIG